jgi:hypothetical protein
MAGAARGPADCKLGVELSGMSSAFVVSAIGRLCRRFVRLVKSGVPVRAWIAIAIVLAASIAMDGGCSASAADMRPTARIELRDAKPAPDHVRFVYVVPKDGRDNGYDTSGDLARSVARSQEWLARQIDGRQFRIVKQNGEPEILFARLPVTDEYLYAVETPRADGYKWTDLDRYKIELAKIRPLRKDERLVSFYDGPVPTNWFGCGAAILEDQESGLLALLFLRPSLKNLYTCTGLSETRPSSGLLYLDLGIVHEVFHLLGAVPRCAPHARSLKVGNPAFDRHVHDDPRDLMAPVRPDPILTTIDKARDDYYGHGRPDCLDIARSPFFADRAEVTK